MIATGTGTGALFRPFAPRLSSWRTVTSGSASATGGASAWTGVETGAGPGCWLAAALVGRGAAVESSSSDRTWKYTAMATIRIRKPAPSRAYIINWGGTVLVSVIARSATSRTCTLGFSSFWERRCASGDGSDTSAIGSGGGANTGSFIGGSSSKSEKLLPAEV